MTWLSFQKRFCVLEYLTSSRYWDGALRGGLASFPDDGSTPGNYPQTYACFLSPTVVLRDIVHSVIACQDSPLLTQRKPWAVGEKPEQELSTRMIAVKYTRPGFNLRNATVQIYVVDPLSCSSRQTTHSTNDFPSLQLQRLSWLRAASFLLS